MPFPVPLERSLTLGLARGVGVVLVVSGAGAVATVTGALQVVAIAGSSLTVIALLALVLQSRPGPLAEVRARADAVAELLAELEGEDVDR
jgi:hypothetical protein